MTSATLAKPTRMRIRVIDHAEGGRPAVNVTVPMGLVRFGLTMARAVSPELQDVDIDWEAVSTSIDAGESGQIVDVEDEKQQRTVDVFLE